jgi:hypothetical protein
MNNDEALEEFIQILGRIRTLLGEATISDGASIDLDAAVEQLRESGNDTDADELAALCKRADELKAQQQANSS